MATSGFVTRVFVAQESILADLKEIQRGLFWLDKPFGGARFDYECERRWYPTDPWNPIGIDLGGGD